MSSKRFDRATERIGNLTPSDTHINPSYDGVAIERIVEALGPTLYVQGNFSAWWDAGADAREYAANQILAIWVQELNAAGADATGAKVVVMDKQRIRIVEAP